MRSIRKTLIVGTIGAMVTLLIASGAFLYLTVRASLLRQFDQALLDKAHVLIDSVEVKSGRIVFDNEDLDMAEFHSKKGPGFLHIGTTAGDSIYRSPLFEDFNLEYELDDDQDLSLGSAQLPDGRRVRVVRARFEPQVDDEDVTEASASGVRHIDVDVAFMFARDIAPVMDTLRRLELILLVFGIGTIALASALLHSVIHRALKPLNTLALKIGSIMPDELAAALAISNCPLELQPVVERLNGLLVRLKHAFDRERGFSADVAHELRTPLAGLRSTIEVTLTRERTAPEYESALNECLDVASAMQVMIENLLTLARLDSGEFEVVPEDVELGPIVAAALAPQRHAFAARNIDVQWDAEENIALESDSSLLHIVARNLLDNALAYTNDGGWVRIVARGNGANAVLRVSNSGCRITADQANSVFERFWRADASRTGTGTHCGLGLSLVKKIVTTLGGTVEAVSSGGGVFEIAVTIPKRQNLA